MIDIQNILSRSEVKIIAVFLPVDNFSAALFEAAHVLAQLPSFYVH